jgi:hypothetical protein
MLLEDEVVDSVEVVDSISELNNLWIGFSTPTVICASALFSPSM